MSKYDWLLVVHVTAAFLLLGGSILAAALTFYATRRERPSEVALLLGLTRGAVVLIGVGSVVTLAIGLWLVSVRDYSYTDAWVVAAIVLWLYAGGAGGKGGKRATETRLLAERLAAAGDQPSPELRARLRDPMANFLLYSAGVAIVAILVLMVWKPGA